MKWLKLINCSQTTAECAKPKWTNILIEPVPSAPPQAFGFINLVLWAGNLWFIFKETGWLAHFAGTYVPSAEKPPAPDSFGQQGYGEGYGQQDPYAGSQGGYQPDYGQEGGYNDGGYNQGGYEQEGGPTSFSNQMWAWRKIDGSMEVSEHVTWHEEHNTHSKSHLQLKTMLTYCKVVILNKQDVLTSKMSDAYRL